MNKYAFIDRDGVLIFEPQDDFQVDSLEKLQILDGVIEGLQKLQKEGYKLIMVSNQNGIGTPSFPEKDFRIPQEKMLEIFKENEIEFQEIFVCPHFQKDNCSCRKPKTGMVTELFKNTKINLEESFMVGDRDTDRQFAENLGLRFIPNQTNGRFMQNRTAKVKRDTTETQVEIELNLDGTGKYEIETGIGFLNHMLELFSKHSLIDLKIRATGDLEIDEHHTVEDVGIVLGQALKKALGEKKGIQRYSFLLPMDETLAEVALDLGGRSYLVWNVEFKRETIGDMPTELFEDFFRALSESLGANLHINLKYGRNEHHIAEGIFKAFARAMRFAVSEDPRAKDLLPSTKGKT